MNVVVFGVTGMVGHGVLLECLADAGITRVVGVARKPSGITHAKYQEILHQDFTDYSAIASQLQGLDACLFCLGTSSAGMKEDAYRRITYDFTLAAAKTLLQVNPQLRFCYVSGASTDSSEKGRMMWARVKGKTENDLLALTPHAHMFRPGYIHPVKGVTSATPWLRALYSTLGPVLYPVLRTVAPQAVTTTEILGRAMIAAGRGKTTEKILEVPAINALGAL